MAKAQKEIALGPQFMHYGDIAVYDELNSRPAQDYGDPKAIIASLATAGWYDRQTVNCFDSRSPGYAESFESLVDQVVARRKDIIEATQAQAAKDTQMAARLLVYKSLWMMDDGSYRRPKVLNNMCFRRLKNYPDAMVLRMNTTEKADLVGSVETIPTQIPVNIKVYQSEADRIEDQLIENERNNEGKNEVSFVAKLKASKPLFEAGRREAHFRKFVFKDGLGQKIYSILKLDRVQPAYDLFNRIMLDPTDPRYVPGQSLNPNVIRPLYRKDGKDNVPTVEEIDEVIAKIVGKVSNDPKIMSKSDIKSLNTQNPNPAVQLVTKAILDNKPEDVLFLSDLSAHFDEVIKQKNRGKAPELLAYLKAFSG
jgi:hypothetical protein